MHSSIRPDLYGEDRLLKGRAGAELSRDFAKFVLVNGERVKCLSAGGSRVGTVRNSWNIYTVSCLFVALGFSACWENAAEAR